MPARQGFHTVDYLRLEVEVPSVGLSNLVPNPDGELGAWGWITPVALSKLKAYDYTTPDPDQRWLTFFPGSGGGPRWFYTEPLPMTPGEYAAAYFLVAGSFHARAQFEWLDVDGVLLSSSTQSGYYNGLLASGGVAGGLSAVAAPGSTAFVRLRVDVYQNGTGADPISGGSLYIRHATVATAVSSGPLTGLGYLPAADFEDILGPTHEIRTFREALNLGTLDATIYDASLDPLVANTIRSGRRIRLVALEAGGLWEPLFTGRILNADVEYDVAQADDDHRTKIVLSAVDPVQEASNVARPEGVADIDELPYLLEGAGIPWNVNDSGNQVASAVVVANNPNASLIDQIAITRDNELGFAWVDRRGVMNVWDASTYAAASGTFDEDSYNSIKVGYSTDDCINEVVVTVLLLDPVTAQTEEVTYGPWSDAASVAEWGRRRATFTVYPTNIDWYEGTPLPPMVDAILAANGTPTPACSSLRYPVTDPASAFDRAYTNCVFRDLYDSVTISNDRAGGSLGDHRITRIEHTITPRKWLVDLGFSTDGSVAMPQVTPSPTVGGKTLTELLRPVGELTNWIGDEADCPAGWLICDGSSFDAGTYPKLAALLGGTTLPNFTDRFLIGAGSKALLTTGGNVTHTHSLSDAGYAQIGLGATLVVGRTTFPGLTYTESYRVGGSNQTEGGSQGSHTPLRGATDDADSTPPYVAAWVMVRAT
ncbi:phage tail protein [Nocardioides sp.]|uniref:phage tail protein n=1 Tax=Nocardioides sp. TaxID=35761 RepID=UPI0035615B73